jgi:hypothetical protein
MKLYLCLHQQRRMPLHSRSPDNTAQYSFKCPIQIEVPHKADNLSAKPINYILFYLEHIRVKSPWNGAALLRLLQVHRKCIVVHLCINTSDNEEANPNEQGSKGIM